MKLYLKNIATPLGEMIAVANEKALILLDFSDSKYVNKNLPQDFSEERNDILERAERELHDYFAGKSTQFSIPLQFSGTEFQQKVWQELLKIPYGNTISYQEQSENIGNPLAIRAVANANSKNKIAIIVPCHRVIGKNKSLIGYAGGIDKKVFLLDLESKGKSRTA